MSEDDVALAGIPTTRERPSSSGSRTSSSQRPSRGQAAQRGGGETHTVVRSTRSAAEAAEKKKS